MILLSPFSPYILIMLYKFYDIKWEMEETTKSYEEGGGRGEDRSHDETRK